VIPLTVSALVPLLLIVNVRVAVVSTVTGPNTRSPLSPITRVAANVADQAVVTVPGHGAGSGGHPEVNSVAVSVPDAAVADVNVPLT
jgi:isopentenyl phosphate kinase